MSIVDKILGHQPRRRSINEYERIDLTELEGDIEDEDPEKEIHIAEITGQEGIMDVCDLIYDGDIVLADISFFNTTDKRKETVVEDLRKATEDVGGDIVQKGNDEVILTPSGVEISRDKIQK